MNGRPGAGHPYTKLLDELDGARLVRVDRARGRVLAWRGARRVDVFNLEGALADFFVLDASVRDVDAVSAAMDGWMADGGDD